MVPQPWRVFLNISKKAPSKTFDFPYLNFTQSPHAITSLLRYAFPSAAKFTRGSAFQIHPLFASFISSACKCDVFSVLGNLVK
jgi:hypothetical protein